MPNESESKNKLHLTFVEMLFALAVGQVAISLSKLIDYNLLSAQKFLALLPAYSHLMLAFVVISTSWVGWRKSEFSGTNIKSIFTWDYIELAVDVALVVMYFALARAVEIPDSHKVAFSPDALYEARAVAIIITTYWLWDLITCRTRTEKAKQRMWASIFCMLISWFLVVFRIGRSGTVWAVLSADCSLIGLILTFRAMKLHDLSKHSPKSWLLIFALLVGVFAFAFASVYL